MRIILNGQDAKVQDAITVLDLLRQRGLDPAKVVVERNMEIVPGEAFGQTALAEGDRLEVLAFVGGG